MTPSVQPADRIVQRVIYRFQYLRRGKNGSLQYRRRAATPIQNPAATRAGYHANGRYLLPRYRKSDDDTCASNNRGPEATATKYWRTLPSPMRNPTDCVANNIRGSAAHNPAH